MTEEERQKLDEEAERQQAHFDSLFTPIAFKGIIQKKEEVRCCGPKCPCIEILFSRDNSSYLTTPSFEHDFCTLKGTRYLDNKILMFYDRAFALHEFGNNIRNFSSPIIYQGDSIIKKAGMASCIVKKGNRINTFKPGY